MNFTKEKAGKLSDIPIGKDVLLRAAPDCKRNYVTLVGLRIEIVAVNRISGTAVFRDAAADEIVRGMYFNGTISDWQIDVPDLGCFEAPMQVSNLEFKKKCGSEVSYHFAIDAAGIINFSSPTLITCSIRQLVWEQNSPTIENDLWAKADEIDRSYSISPAGNLFNVDTRLYLSDNDEDLGLHPTPEAAKAAAQSHFENRITRALQDHKQ